MRTNGYGPSEQRKKELLQDIATKRRPQWNLGVRTTVAAAALLCAIPVAGQLSAPLELREDGTAPFGPSISDGQFGENLLAGDFDGDGYDDLAVTRRRNASGASVGLVHLLRGGPSGLAYWQTLTQFGTDGFGDALAACDLDGDGDDDLIVGAPYTDISTVNSAGAVFVYLGGPVSVSNHQALTQDDIGLDADDSDKFGSSLDTGDFDGDGHCDVAAGSPGEDDTGNRGSTPGAGLVSVLFGQGNGSLDTASALSFREAAIPATTSVSAGSNDEFGHALAASHEPGRDRLLVGVPGKDGLTLSNLGRVWLVEFDGRSLDTGSFVDLLDTGGLAGTPDGFEEFGFALAAGSFVGGTPIAVIGTPGYTSSTIPSMGAVFFLPLADFGAGTQNFSRLDQNFSVFESAPANSEHFGHAVHVTDIDGNGLDDLIIATPNDRDETSRGSGPASTGAVHVLYNSGPNFSSFDNLFGSDISSVYRDFGAAIAAGNFFGDGGRSVAVGAPSTNLPSRGVGDDDNHGAVYVYRNTAAPKPSQLIALAGTSPENDDWTITGFSNPAPGAGGVVGFRAELQLEGQEEKQTRVYADGLELQRDSQVACAEGDFLEEGFALASVSAFGYFNRVETGCPSFSDFDRGLVGPAGFLATESTVVPGGSVGRPSRPISTSDGRIYFLGRDFLDTRRILRTAPNASLPLEVVSAEGDSVGSGQFLKFIETYDVSDSGNHRIELAVVGAIADVEAVLLNGVPVLYPNATIPDSTPMRGGDPPRLVGSYLDAAVDDAGNHLLTVRDTQSDIWLTYGSAGTLTSAIQAGSSLDQVSLDDLEPKALSISNGVALHLWGPPVVNRGIGGVTGTALFAACADDIKASRLVLGKGSFVDIEGGAPAEVVSIPTPTGSEGLQVAGDARVYLNLRLRRGSTEFEAIAGFDVGCAFFADGFESGNTANWD